MQVCYRKIHGRTTVWSWGIKMLCFANAKNTKHSWRRDLHPQPKNHMNSGIWWNLTQHVGTSTLFKGFYSCFHSTTSMFHPNWKAKESVTCNPVSWSFMIPMALWIHGHCLRRYLTIDNQPEGPCRKWTKFSAGFSRYSHFHTKRLVRISLYPSSRLT